MEEILDHEDVQKKRSKLFSVLSFCFALISLGIIALVINQSPLIDSLDKDVPISRYIFFVTVLVGVVCTLFAFLRKEEATIYKVLGATVNFGFVFFICSIFFIIQLF